MELKYSPLGSLKLFLSALLGASVCYGYVGVYAKHFSYSPEAFGGAWVALIVFSAVGLLALGLSLRRGVRSSFAEISKNLPARGSS